MQAQDGRPRLGLRIVALVILLFAGGAAYWFGSNRSEPPLANGGLVVAEGDLNLGEVWADPKFPLSLTVSNESAATLRVVGIVSSCGCSVVEPHSFALESGQTKKLNVRLDLTSPAALRPAHKGNVQRFAVKLIPRLQGRVHGRPVPWYIRGTVKTAIKLQPKAISFSDSLIQGQRAALRTVNVESFVRLKELRAFSDRPGIATVAVRKSLQQPQSYKVVIIPRDDLPVGDFKLHVRIRPVLATGELLPQYNIPVQGKVLQDMQAVPANLVFGARTVGTTAVDEIVVRSWSKKPFKIMRIDGDNKYVRITKIKDLADGKLLRVNQVIGKTGPQTAQVRIVAENHLGKEVAVPLFCSYLGKSK